MSFRISCARSGGSGGVTLREQLHTRRLKLPELLEIGYMSPEGFAQKGLLGTQFMDRIGFAA